MSHTHNQGVNQGTGYFQDSTKRVEPLPMPLKDIYIGNVTVISPIPAPRENRPCRQWLPWVSHHGAFLDAASPLDWSNNSHDGVTPPGGGTLETLALCLELPL